MIKDTNVFVISHKTDELIDKFDKIITFEKVKGFSGLAHRDYLGGISTGTHF